jgi:hypothetical protein
MVILISLYTSAVGLLVHGYINITDTSAVGLLVYGYINITGYICCRIISPWLYLYHRIPLL